MAILKGMNFQKMTRIYVEPQKLFRWTLFSGSQLPKILNFGVTYGNPASIYGLEEKTFEFHRELTSIHMIESKI